MVGSITGQLFYVGEAVSEFNLFARTDKTTPSNGCACYCLQINLGYRPVSMKRKINSQIWSPLAGISGKIITNGTRD